MPIDGEGFTIEIDGSKFGKRKFNRGHHLEGQWVFGGFERESGRIFLVLVQKRDEATLFSLVKTWTLSGTLIISDSWRSYINVNSERYKHLTVNHKVSFKDPLTGAHMNSIESTWRHAKLFFPNKEETRSAMTAISLITDGQRLTSLLRGNYPWYQNFRGHYICSYNGVKRFQVLNFFATTLRRCTQQAISQSLSFDLLIGPCVEKLSCSKVNGNFDS